MNAAAERFEFAPPPTAGLYRALVLAILAHALLLVALTWAVRWKSDTTPITAEAELWSSVPRQAAPRAVEPPRPEPVAAPTPPRVAPAPVPPKVADADIALERERQQRIQQDKQLAAEKMEQARRRQQDEQAERADQARKLSAAKLEQAKRRQQVEQAQRAEQAREAAQAKQQQAQKQAEKLALDKKKEEQEAKRQEALKAQEDLKRQAAVAAQRADNLKRMAALAGSGGSPSSSGTAVQPSGPSGSYGGKVSAKVKPNIVFLEDLAGNPTAEVEVRAAPDGTIVGRKLVKSSGHRSWDEAVLKAIDKTETLPRDTDGRVPSLLVISFRPKD